jgi:CheY-like chemotaxis protein
MGKGNVLVVEDDDAIRRLLVDLLAQSAYVTVDGARDGVEALHLISTQRYSVVLLDLMMPKMSGVDLLDSLQAKLSDPSLKALDSRPAVIIITATTASALPAASLEHRFPELVRGVFRKPADMSKLATLVSQLLVESAKAQPTGDRPTA